jgi:putative endonuclease
MASKCYGRLYIGSTSDRIKRVSEYKNKVILERFTAQYNGHVLIYYAPHGNDMPHRAQHFKNWGKKWKLNLIKNVNPKWNDLYEEIGR